MKLKIYLLLTIPVLLLLSGCGEKNEEPVEKKVKYIVKDNPVIPKFHADSALALIRRQVDFGPRVPGSEAHRAARQYFVQFLREVTDTVIEQNFTYNGYDGEVLSLTNIISKINPDSAKRILLCAHWDTRPRSDMEKDSVLAKKPIMGANDGASGVGVLLEVARVLSVNNPGYGVDIVLFDGEDYAKNDDFVMFCLGSKYFAANTDVKSRYIFGVLLDLVGDKEAVFKKEGTSLNFAPEVVDLFWSTSGRLGLKRFSNERGKEIYDDHVPLNQAGLKTINIIDADLVGHQVTDERRKYWHTNNDTMENIGIETLDEVGRLLLNVIYSIRWYVE
ncbi:MAG: M28 family peptidase [Ignavibacteriaceae bacterium]|nr:M28 family peptidase [Ignavibacteriaceae bacterium]